eukprot:1253012-Rhodomonas_salina.1
MELSAPVRVLRAGAPGAPLRLRLRSSSTGSSESGPGPGSARGSGSSWRLLPLLSRRGSSRQAPRALSRSS